MDSQWWEILGANAERKGAYGVHVDPGCKLSAGHGFVGGLTLTSAQRAAFPPAPAPQLGARALPSLAFGGCLHLGAGSRGKGMLRD